MKGGKLLFLAVDIIILIVFLELISSVFSFVGNLFVFEFIVLLILLLMAVGSMFQLSDGNTRMLSMFFALTLVNEIGLNIFTRTELNILLIVVAAFGFIIAILNSQKEENEGYDELGRGTEDEVITEEIKTEEKAVVKEYYPSKFLASKTGKKYHIPKCDFAKKIPKRKQVWFDEKKEARKKGYGPCKCIKK